MDTIKLPKEVKVELEKISTVAGYLWQRECAERLRNTFEIPLFSKKKKFRK